MKDLENQLLHMNLKIEDIMKNPKIKKTLKKI